MKPALPLVIASLTTAKVGAFAFSAHQSLSSTFAPSPSAVSGAFYSGKNTCDVVGTEEWIALTDDGGAKLRTISIPSEAGEGLPLPGAGDDVTVEYVGRIHPRNWSAEDVNACWLPEQGLTPLAPKLFEAFDIDGDKLTNAKKMSKKFIFEGLGVLKEAKIDTLFRAAQELKESERTHPAGTVFDENAFTFRLGKGGAIRAFDLAIREMRVGQTASLVVRCDYAYGKRGLRVSGKVLVPPYATVQYDLTLVEIK